MRSRKLHFSFIILTIFLMALVLFFVPIRYVFFVISSENYNVDSASSGLSGGSAESPSYSAAPSSGFESSSSAESPTYSATPGVQEQTSGAPTDEEETPTPTPSSGGGGSSTTIEQCAYDWVCTEWYPSPCPASEIQNKLCVNKGTCDGTSGMPETNRTCIYNPAEPLFDIFAKIPIAKKQITSQDVLEAEISVINAGEIKQLDIFFKYWIVDENNKLITEMQETRAIKSKDKFTIRMNLPSDAKAGKYKFFTQITYDDGKIAIANDSFEIISKIQFLTFFYVFAIAFFIVLFLTSFLLYKLLKERRG